MYGIGLPMLFPSLIIAQYTLPYTDVWAQDFEKMP
jgi:hypothetical protein